MKRVLFTTVLLACSLPTFAQGDPSRATTPSPPDICQGAFVYPVVPSSIIVIGVPPRQQARGGFVLPRGGIVQGAGPAGTGGAAPSGIGNIASAGVGRMQSSGVGVMQSSGVGQMQSSGIGQMQSLGIGSIGSSNGNVAVPPSSSSSPGLWSAAPPSPLSGSRPHSMSPTTQPALVPMICP